MRSSEIDDAQNFIQISQAWNHKNKPVGYFFEFQYVLKNKKQCDKLQEVIEKCLNIMLKSQSSQSEVNES